MIKYIYLTNLLYNALTKVSDDGYFSCYGTVHLSGWIIPLDILRMALYDWIIPQLINKTIILMELPLYNILGI